MTGSVSGTVFSPSTGVAGNLLTPGTYNIFLFGVLYNGTTVTTNTSLTFGVASHPTTNPTTGSTIITSLNIGGYTVIGSSISSLSFSPSFVFTVTTSAYYYGFVTSTVNSTNGTFAIGVKSCLVRVA